MQDKKVSEDAPTQYKQVLGIGFLPSKAKKPYFVPLHAHDFELHEVSSSLDALPGTVPGPFLPAKNEFNSIYVQDKVTLAERCGLFKRFVESESIKKVCYDTQESLKPILALYPRYSGEAQTLFHLPFFAHNRCVQSYLGIWLTQR